MADNNEEPIVPPAAAAAAAAEEEPAGDAAPAEEGGDDHVPEEENLAHFDAVVNLPEVEVVNGEEDEEELYSQRAKLFIHGETMLDRGTGNKQWIERGVGNIRILQHRDNRRVRILMRQEKTMRPIMNHLLLPDLVLVVHTTTDRAWIWRAMDFATGELLETDFCVRFGNMDIANTFRENFERFQQEMGRVIEAEREGGEQGGAPPAAADAGEEGAAADEAAAALQNLAVNDEEQPAADATAPSNE